MKYEVFFPHHKIMIGLLLMAGLSSSCKRLIEIPPNPATAVTEAQQFSDSATAMTAVAGCFSYQSNGGGSFTFNDGNLARNTGMSSDELIYTYTGDPAGLQFYANNLNAFNGSVSGMWASPYIGLYPVNATINGIAASSGLSASFKKATIAELKVVRALYYFYMINIFGGVPYVSSTDYQATSRLARSPVDTVYARILSDLTDAQQALPEEYPSEGRFLPNRNVASAFLSKVYLYRQEWQKAYDAANTVISSGEYILEPDLNNVFLEGSQEAIWQLPATGSYSVTSEAQSFVPQSSGTVPTYIFTSLLKDAFESGDQRLDKWAMATTVNIGGVDQVFYSPYKYKNVYPGATVEDYMIFRLGEVYLIRAEAAAHLGNTGEALDDLNQVRLRAGVSASTASTEDDLLAAIMHERQTELFTEWGSRWLDLKRTGTIDAVLGAEKPGWDAHDALYPIPNAQLNLNGLLKQNPGYQ